MAEAVSDWLALAIEEVDEKSLLPGVIGKDGTLPHLPRQLVKMPFENPNEVAIVSWRWDGDLKTKGSSNIASVVHCAKQRGIKYLLIDIISIDQTLPASDLIKLVLAFSALYTKITILAAYDMVGLDVTDMKYTLSRPWILNEIRLFRRNPGTLVYVGHSNQGSKIFDSYMQGAQRDQPDRSRFTFILDRVWGTGFVDSIIGVLNGDVGMAVVSDFKYIIPAYSHVISIAYDQMERNDYLLTIAVLCGIYERIEWLNGPLQRTVNIQGLSYSRYSFNLVPHDEDSWTIYEICLDGTRVALLTHEEFVEGVNDRYEFKTFPGAEQVIFKALGLPEADYEDFVHQEEARRACLTMDDTMDLPIPNLEVIEVSFPFK